jgi:hypothetical protein
MFASRAQWIVTPKGYYHLSKDGFHAVTMKLSYLMQVLWSFYNLLWQLSTGQEEVQYPTSFRSKPYPLPDVDLFPSVHVYMVLCGFNASSRARVAGPMLCY